MSRKSSMENEFSRNVDRLLAGEKVEAPPGASEDYRTALDFAGKMISFRGSPSPVFQRQLREKLLARLREEEARAAEKRTGGWLEEALRRLAPQSPVWRTVAVTLVVVLMIGTVLWRMGGALAPAAPALDAPAAPADVKKGAPEMARLAPAPAPAPEPTPAPPPAPAPAPALPAAPPSVFIEKTVEVNQSRTATGITVTLQRVELSAAGMRVFAFITLTADFPAHFPLPQGTRLGPVVEMQARARYSVDGGAAKDSGITVISSDPGAAEPAWDGLEPVPQGARQLTFTVTSLGEMEGPWEFVVELG